MDAQLPTWLINVLTNLGVGALFFWLFDQERKSRQKEREQWQEDQRRREEAWNAERLRFEQKLESLTDKTHTAFIDNTRVVEGIKTTIVQQVQTLGTLTEHIYELVKRN